MDLTTSQPAMPEGVNPMPTSGMGDLYGIKEKAEDPKDKLTRDIEKHFKSQAELADRNKKDYHYIWKRNVQLRQGNPNDSYTSQVVQNADDDYQSELNPDWYLTKSKVADLFSQTPGVQLEHINVKFSPAVGPFAKSINYELGEKRCHIGAAMYEVLNDVVNASGIGAIHVGYAARFQDKEVPRADTAMLPPEVKEQMLKAGTLPMETVPEVVDYRFFTRRLSPDDILWPAGFTSSDFDLAPWLGEKIKTSGPEAKAEWKLSDEDMERLNSDEPSKDETLNTNKEANTKSEMKIVRGKRIFYWRYRVDPDCLYFNEIWEIVWLDGIDKPVYHDKWKGQKFDEQAKKYIGSCKLPIRICTITYITDNAVPPSDTQAGRPQVNDLRRSRSQLMQNRAYSTPLRWFNTDKSDPTMHSLLMRGQVQGMIPVQGDGQKVIGEVARASYPAEDTAFDKMSMDDLMRTWGRGPNQLGQLASHETTKGEAELAQGGFNSVATQERGRVTAFFLGTVEVLAGLMALYSDFPNLSDQERQVMRQAWDNTHILHDLAFSILPDSQIAVDTQTQIKRITQYLNITAKSGFVQVKPLIVKLTELHGLDPSEYVTDPKPHPAKPASMSFSFKGKDDLNNPMVVALLARNQQLPSPEEIDLAKEIILKLQMGVPMKPPQKPGMPGQPPRPGMPPMPARPGLPPGPSSPIGGGPRPGQDMMPQWALANKVAKRTRDVTTGA